MKRIIILTLIILIVGSSQTFARPFPGTRDQFHSRVREAGFQTTDYTKYHNTYTYYVTDFTEIPSRASKVECRGVGPLIYEARVSFSISALNDMGSETTRNAAIKVANLFNYGIMPAVGCNDWKQADVNQYINFVNECVKGGNPQRIIIEERTVGDGTLSSSIRQEWVGGEHLVYLSMNFNQND